MPDDPSENAERVSTRAELLPEEETAGSDAPGAQAEAILSESDERTESRDAAPSTHLETRSSDEVTEPPD